jgi:hypothetical protein
MREREKEREKEREALAVKRRKRHPLGHNAPVCSRRQKWAEKVTNHSKIRVPVGISGDGNRE